MMVSSPQFWGSAGGGWEWRKDGNVCIVRMHVYINDCVEVLSTDHTGMIAVVPEFWGQILLVGAGMEERDKRSALCSGAGTM